MRFLRASRRYLIVLVSLLMSITANGDPSTTARGEYLTQLLGCGRCHTDGELLGRRDGPWLAGSTIGIAYTGYEANAAPGIVFASNLTPDVATGLGGWTKEDIVQAIRSGIDHRGATLLTVMPWPAYGLLNDEDAQAIAEYLTSMDPAEREIPENVPKGTASDLPYVRVGIYTFSEGLMIDSKTFPLDRN